MPDANMFLPSCSWLTTVSVDFGRIFILVSEDNCFWCFNMQIWILLICVKISSKFLRFSLYSFFFFVTNSFKTYLLKTVTVSLWISGLVVWAKISWEVFVLIWAGLTQVNAVTLVGSALGFGVWLAGVMRANVLSVSHCPEGSLGSFRWLKRF